MRTSGETGSDLTSTAARCPRSHWGRVFRKMRSKTKRRAAINKLRLRCAMMLDEPHFERPKRQALCGSRGFMPRLLAASEKLCPQHCETWTTCSCTVRFETVSPGVACQEAPSPARGSSSWRQVRCFVPADRVRRADRRRQSLRSTTTVHIADAAAS